MAGSRCTSCPGEDTTGNGEIHVTGIYKAYGQDLTIQQGRLLFAGQAINDPQVNLIATRTVDTVTAKLIVSGSAQKPLLEVSSDPPMPQTQALSYLVTGKPINEVGSGEGDLVQSAARSLGGAAGNLLAKRLGQAPRRERDRRGRQRRDRRLRLHRRPVPVAAPVSQLRRRPLRARPGSDAALPHQNKVSLEAVQGPLSQKAGINYRVEKSLRTREEVSATRRRRSPARWDARKTALRALDAARPVRRRPHRGL